MSQYRTIMIMLTSVFSFVDIGLAAKTGDWVFAGIFMVLFVYSTGRFFQIVNEEAKKNENK